MRNHIISMNRCFTILFTLLLSSYSFAQRSSAIGGHVDYMRAANKSGLSVRIGFAGAKPPSRLVIKWCAHGGPAWGKYEGELSQSYINSEASLPDKTWGCWNI